MVRLLGVVATEDPDRAENWTRRLNQMSAPVSATTGSGSAAIPAQDDVPSRAAQLIERLLTEVHGFVSNASTPSAVHFASGVSDTSSDASSSPTSSVLSKSESTDPVSGPSPAPKPEEERASAPRVPASRPASSNPSDAADPEGSSDESGDVRESHAGSESAQTDSDQPRRFHLAVDDAGEFLVVAGERICVGHARGDKADLPFLADLESEHAYFARGESFHGGPIWCLESTGNALYVNDEVPESDNTILSDGDEVRFGDNLRMRFTLPDSSSSTALLVLMHGAESEGAARVLLMGAGRAGRIRMGARTSRHVPVPDLEDDVTLQLDEGILSVEAKAKMSVFPEVAAAAKGFEFACPPSERLDFTVRIEREKKPPFGFSVRPVEADTGAVR